MGNQPREEDCPPELDDFSTQVQEAVNIYRYLKDIWDSMSGQYLGKDLSIIFNLFDLLETAKEDRRLILTFIQTMDAIRSQIVESKREKPSK